MKSLLPCCLILVVWLYSSCGTSTPKIDPLPVDLDSYYFNNELNFKLKPPLDWEQKNNYDSTVFVPPDTELESRSAFVRIEIRFEKTDTGFTPEEFKEMIVETLNNTEGIDNLEILEYGGAPANAFLSLVMEHETPKGVRILYFKNILTKNGYFQICGSAVKEKWALVEALLKNSISTFEKTK